MTKEGRGRPSEDLKSKAKTKEQDQVAGKPAQAEQGEEEEEEEDEYLDWSPAEEATSDDDSEGSHLSYRKLREWKSELERLRSQKSASRPSHARGEAESVSESASESESESSSVAEMEEQSEQEEEEEGAIIGPEQVRKSTEMQVALAQKQAAKVIETASVLEGIEKAETVGLKPVDQLKVASTPKQTAP